MAAAKKREKKQTGKPRGRPIQPGQVLNPAGRRPGVPNRITRDAREILARIVSEGADKAAEVIMAEVNNGDVSNWVVIARQLAGVRAEVAVDLRGRLEGLLTATTTREHLEAEAQLAACLGPEPAASVVIEGEVEK